jgi:hypothetical protein
MEENELFDRLKNFHGVCYIETLDNIVDKKKAKEFCRIFYGVPYSKLQAALSGLDIGVADFTLKVIPKTGLFCSWLTALFIISQGISLKTKTPANELTPSNIFNLKLGFKRTLYESK